LYSGRRLNHHNRTQEIPTDFSRIHDFLENAQKAGEYAQKVPTAQVNAAGEAVAAVAGVLAGLLPNEVIDEEIEQTVTDEHELSFQFATGTTVGTVTHAGPGMGDVIHYLINPVFGWLVVPATGGGVRVTLCLLG
jgi:hypothetical protein